jgi:hypothetical protein
MSKDFASSNPFRKAASKASSQSASQPTSTEDEAHQASNDELGSQERDIDGDLCHALQAVLRSANNSIQ